MTVTRQKNLLQLIADTPSDRKTLEKIRDVLPKGHGISSVNNKVIIVTIHLAEMKG
jgi:hypothetical protein